MFNKQSLFPALLVFTVLSLVLIPGGTKAQSGYWNNNTLLIPWRMPMITDVQYIDLDKDGDPDVLKAQLNGVIPIMWIDDDDDMKYGDTEGDTDSDCLLIDRNKDGIFAGPFDFSIKWCDENHDGRADLELIVSNGGTSVHNFFDWGADYMYILDEDHDQIMHYVDWNKIMMQAWDHDGHASFYEDYHGNTTFMKMHASSFRIQDLRYNWENPFIFYDTDGDNLTEMAIRLVDSPVFRDNKTGGSLFDSRDTTREVAFSKRIDYAAITWDLDNDNGPGNEFDFDMSLLFKGKGFSYDDEIHHFNSLKGLKAANKFLYDSRWRNLNELVFPDRKHAYNLIFEKGDWQECRLVFDEDDDCNRWERVEFYDPLDPFIIGAGKGGLDNNKQADASGDRGEFDMDNSGNGKLYIGAFDGRIHLYGAEWGAWRIDQGAFSFQGFGGLYEKWGPDRLQVQPQKFPTVKYTDTDHNGFIDQIEYDLDGDKTFEEKVSLRELGIDDKAALINTAGTNYRSFNALFNSVAEKMWKRAQQAESTAKKFKINTQWYSYYQKPKSIWQKYDYGYWLNLYLYHDMRQTASLKGDRSLIRSIDRAYYSGNWGILDSVTAEDVNEKYKRLNSGRFSPKNTGLFFKQSDILHIKKLYKANDPIINIGYEQLKKTADDVLTQPVMTYGLDAAHLRIPSIHQFATQLPSLVMLYQLTGERQYAERAWLQLAEFIKYPDWGANRHFLDSGIASFDFALAYDGLSGYLSDRQKKELRDAELKNVLLPAKQQMEDNIWWHNATNNWNGICNGGLIMAALGMYDSNPSLMSKMIALALNGLPHYINAFEPAGQSEEGVMYWHYGLMYTTLALQALQNKLGTAFDLDNSPGFKKTGWFPIYLSGPVTGLSIGDDPLKETKNVSFFWFAKHFNDAPLARVQYNLCLEHNQVSWDDMLFYDPSLISGKASRLQDLPVSNYMPGIDVMSIRESWNPDALFISMHGGSNRANHGHLDAGSFDIQGLGKVWAYGDLGSDNYIFPGYFSKVTKPGYYEDHDAQTEAGRWHFFRLRAEGKDCIVINPGTRPDQDPEGQAVLVDSASSGNDAYYVLDLKSCYNRDVSDYKRGIRMDRTKKLITVQDEIDLLRPSTIWWNMNTRANISLSKNEKHALLTIGDKLMNADIAGPDDAHFVVLPSTYLPGEAFPLTKNSPNSGFQKLAVKINASGHTTVRVDFSPAKKSEIFKNDSTVPLKSWKKHN